jgi:hypothetical protein
MMLGRVDEVDGHFIATRFVAFLFPAECLYIAHKNPRVTLARKNDGNIRIQTDWRSVALGYARVWPPILAVGLPLLQLIAVGTLALPMMAVSMVLASASAVAHVSGRLPEAEKARLRMLGTVTGLRIDPSKLQPNTREVKREQLGELMEKGGIPITPENILAVLEEIPVPALPLVYGYARYSGDDPTWRHCATLIYQRHEQSEY